MNYDHLVTGEVTNIRESNASSGAGVLATYAYDNLGRRTTLTRGNGTTTSYSYDAASRLSQLVQNPAGTTHDLTLGFTYNPASQIATNTRSNDAYARTAHYALNRNYTANGLNQYTASGGVTPTYDSRGNLTSAGGPTYAYNSENMLISATGGVSLAYDPMLRLYQTSDGTTTTRMLYDGASLIAEYNSSNVLQRRYVHGPGVDEPLVWYEGTGTSDRRWLHADERGSVIAITNGTGAVSTVNSYDEYGIPGSTNAGRFQYTGQQWLPELGMYHYRARIYSLTLGRFLQTDPIGYGDGMNMYAYAANDSANLSDPSGLCNGPKVVLTGSHIAECPKAGDFSTGVAFGYSPGVGSARGSWSYSFSVGGFDNRTYAITTGYDRTPQEAAWAAIGQHGLGINELQFASLVSDIFHLALQRTGFVNPYLQISPLSQQLINKVEQDHGGRRAGNSTFYEHLRSAGGLSILLNYAAMNFLPQPASSVGGSVRLACDATYIRPVGWDRSGQVTYNYVVIIQWTGLGNREVARIFNVVAMYPGVRGERP